MPGPDELSGARMWSGIEKQPAAGVPSVIRRWPAPDRATGVDGRPIMAVKTTRTQTDGFSAEERAAMKQRAAELRSESKKGAKKAASKADGLQAVLEAIAKMAPDDRALAERLHVTVTGAAPQLSPKTYYGMPAYANADGKVVVFFQDSGKFKYRYSTLGFQDTAHLDEGEMWPVSYAIGEWSPAVEKRIAELVRAALR
jgi:uncharacterized protein YdhG (YjbR/CyaY superfamily)